MEPTPLDIPQEFAPTTSYAVRDELERLIRADLLGPCCPPSEWTNRALLPAGRSTLPVATDGTFAPSGLSVLGLTARPPQVLFGQPRRRGGAGEPAGELGDELGVGRTLEGHVLLRCVTEDGVESAPVLPSRFGVPVLPVGHRTAGHAELGGEPGLVPAAREAAVLDLLPRPIHRDRIRTNALIASE
jgi:hypothetical protein